MKLFFFMDSMKYASLLQFHFGGFYTKTFQMLDDTMQTQLWLFENMILILWGKTTTLSGQKPVFRHP